MLGQLAVGSFATVLVMASLVCIAITGQIHVSMHITRDTTLNSD